MPTFVALDLETTGLDASADEIIDIGAVRFTRHRIEDEFATLVRPGQHISGFISRLTGITDRMVAHAPTLDEVLFQLEDFIGDAIIIGHNIGFDLKFLRAAGLEFTNEVVDTYDLASVLLPSASRYGLGALGQALGVPFQATHRALDDARVNAHLYRRLAAMIDDLPLDLLAQIVNLGIEANWPGTWPFQEALERRQRAGESPPKHKFRVWPRRITPLPTEPLEETASGTLDAEEIAAMLAPDGALAQQMPRFEHRPHQVAMARAVAKALGDRRHLIIEAGTGTGKSIAYLLPAAKFALENHTRVVISTNTKNLQTQLLEKDIPTIERILGQPVRAAVLQGRGNYLCPHRLEVLLHKKAKQAVEARVLAKVLVWLHQGGSGSRSEINLRGSAEQAVWQRISADAPACTAAACMRHTQGACPFQQARRAAESAHLLVVNHALLLSDVVSGGRVLPTYNYLIVDEAHHMERAVTDALSAQVAYEDINRILQDLGSTRTGLLRSLLAILRKGPAEIHNHIAAQVDRASTDAFAFQESVKHVFAALSDFLEDQREGRPLGQYAQQVRITPAVRHQDAWESVMLAWDEARSALGVFLNTLDHLREAIIALGLNNEESIEDIANEITDRRNRLDEAGALLDALITAQTDNAVIYWIEARPRQSTISLHAAPLEIGTTMSQHIWQAKESVILTSATLTTGGDMDYLRNRLAAEDADELVLGSPFDYEHAALLYVVNDIPEPNRPGYQKAVEEGLASLAEATQGRMMVLFTSYAQLQRTAQAIRPRLEAAGLTVYEQGGGAAPQTLLDGFKTTEGAVLLGTRAFWEGVDVPGEALSVLVIVKLPFAVPSDPVVAARAETFENPFAEYHLPEAILAFRQGFGRLIRTATDRGIVAVFDRRLLTRRYGQAFLDSLPPCTRHQGPMHRLPAVAARWLKRSA